MMRAFIIFISAIVLCFAQAGRSGRAQDGGWRVYSPPGGGFVVELPAPLRKVVWFEGEHGASLEPSQRMKGASCYAVVQTTPEESQFGVTVIDARGELSGSKRRAEFLDYLKIFIGDDDRPEPESVKVIRSGALAGKEYFYIKENGALYTRGRIFDAGDKIYVVVFVGRKAEDLTSPEAERFLNSFRARPKK